MSLVSLAIRFGNEREWHEKDLHDAFVKCIYISQHISPSIKMKLSELKLKTCRSLFTELSSTKQDKFGSACGHITKIDHKQSSLSIKIDKLFLKIVILTSISAAEVMYSSQIIKCFMILAIKLSSIRGKFP